MFNLIKQLLPHVQKLYMNMMMRPLLSTHTSVAVVLN
jgi:hypothetical protein